MNLIIDRGNTLTKAAVVDRGRIVSMQSFERLDMRRLDQFVGRCGAIDKAIICSTAGDTEALAQHLEGSVGLVLRFVPSRVAVPIGNDYLTPETLAWVNERIERPALYWWNFPVTDYVRHIVMLGPTYGLDTSLSEADLCGLVSNPMEHGEASKLALYGVADYAWNIAAYDPIDNWERGLAEAVSAATEAYRTFAIHSCDTETGYRRAESWETETIGLDEYTEERAEALRREFERSERVPAELERAGTDEALLRELRPWLAEFGKLGARGVRTLDLMERYRRGEDEAGFWTAYVANLMSDEERSAFFADVNRVAKALHAAFHPDKINYGAYGDTSGHMHFHLVPKYKDQAEWASTFAMNPEKVFLTQPEYDEIIEKIKANL